MKKYIALIFFLILIFPITISAKEVLEVSCDKFELKASEEAECKIIADDLDFVITGISVKLSVPSDIVIIDSKYNDKKWVMLDDVFNVKDINLINIDPIKEEKVEIASFRIKSNSNKKVKENIKLKDLLIGDQNYEKRVIDVENETIYMNRKGFNIKDYVAYIGIILIALIIFSIIKKW